MKTVASTLSTQILANFLLISLIHSANYIKSSDPIEERTLTQQLHRERRTEAKTDSYSNDRIFQKLKNVY